MTQQSSESEQADAHELQGVLGADLETTADLQGVNTSDLVPSLEEAKFGGMSSAAMKQVETTAPRVASDGGPRNETGQADLPAIDERLPRAIPQTRAVGFFVFAACALLAIIFTTERHGGASPPTAAGFAARSPDTDGQVGAAEAGDVAPDEHARPQRVETRTVPSDDIERKSDGSANEAPSTLVFESRSFVTSEKAVAAVFIVKRTRAVSGSAMVHWAALSGSADAGIDFSDASGTARFADGQRQLAIYVLLRNDLLKERDETFQVCLRSAWHARIVGKCSEATIRDDDVISPT
jgi:hypothetical protein